MNNNIEKHLVNLFNKTFYEDNPIIEPLPRSGSSRLYYRIKGTKHTVIGTYNKNIKENETFFYLTKHFLKKGFNVPQIYAISSDRQYYLQQDLGDTTLYIAIKESQNKKNYTLYNYYYKRILKDLIMFQIYGLKGLDLSKLYGRQHFDIQQVLWDMSYFKNFVLKLAGVPFDEDKLEKDFRILARIVNEVSKSYLLYRDFQSSNILLYNGQFYYIDYQNVMRGNVYYDLVSLLYDSKVNLPQSDIEKYINYYIESFNKLRRLDNRQFYKYFYAFVLIRLLQAIAAYFFRGIVEKKMRFVVNIPNVLDKLLFFVESNPIKWYDFKELYKSLGYLINNLNLIKIVEASDIAVDINSFSYKENGYPVNKTDFGGFVFDCRFLPNPGRIEKYKNLTGLDNSVKFFIQSLPEFEIFMGRVLDIILQALENYSTNGYTRLQVNFGCTGGQHRSVVCAEYFADLLRKFFNGKISINHINIKNLKR